LAIVLGLGGDGGGVAAVVLLEAEEEGVILLLRGDGPGLVDHHVALGQHLDLGVIELEGRRQQLAQLVAEALLAGVHDAVRMHQLVDGRQQGAPVVLVELAEDLEAAQLQLGQHELPRILPVRHGLGEVRLDPRVHLVEHLVEVLGPAPHHILPHGLVVEGGAGPVVDQLVDVSPDKFLLGAIKITVDVPERGQIKDDRVHLVFGGLRIRAERQHAVPI
jgi:hypothetical protein